MRAAERGVQSLDCSSHAIRHRQSGHDAGWQIATASGESKWITGKKARAHGMKLRQGSDAILVGINTILADNPSLTARSRKGSRRLRRIILDSLARTPLAAKVVSDEQAALTTIVVGKYAPKKTRDGTGQVRERAGCAHGQTLVTRPSSPDIG